MFEEQRLYIFQNVINIKAKYMNNLHHRIHLGQC